MVLEGLDVKVLEQPSLEEATAFIKAALAERRLLIIAGECRVDYEGRGASRLEPGERVVIVKQDGAFLVHRPFGYSPVNWQPSTSVIEVAYRPEVGLVIHAVRDSPREYLTVVFTSIGLAVSLKLVDRGEFTMYVDEEIMRDTIAENPWLLEEGFRVVELEKKLGDGYADIYGVDREGRDVVVELKRITATREAVLQLYKYVEVFKKEYGRTPRGILVAPSFSPTALEQLLRLGLEYKQVDLKKVWELAKKKASKKTTLMEFTKGARKE